MTIIEGQEPGEDEQEAGDNYSGDVGKVVLSTQCSSVSTDDGVPEEPTFERQQLLSIPSSSMANSSSAETLTDNTITGGESPTTSTHVAR